MGGFNPVGTPNTVCHPLGLVTTPQIAFWTEIIKSRMQAIDIESDFLERKFVQVRLCITHRSTRSALSVLHDADEEFSPIFVKVG